MRILIIMLALFSLIACSSDDLVNAKKQQILLKKERASNAYDNAEELQDDLDEEI